jgi:hypothetical protein
MMWRDGVQLNRNMQNQQKDILIMQQAHRNMEAIPEIN